MEFFVAQNGLVGASEFQITKAEKRAVWGITKKEFLDPSKKTVFLQFLKTACRSSFRPMNTMVLSMSHFHGLW
jgi:hypothetical protein